MLPLSVYPIDRLPQCLDDAARNGVDGVAGAERLLVDPARPRGTCVTPVLCRECVIACGWPTCCGKSRR